MDARLAGPLVSPWRGKDFRPSTRACSVYGSHSSLLPHARSAASARPAASGRRTILRACIRYGNPPTGGRAQRARHITAQGSRRMHHGLRPAWALCFRCACRRNAAGGSPACSNSALPMLCPGQPARTRCHGMQSCMHVTTPSGSSRRQECDAPDPGRIRDPYQYRAQDTGIQSKCV